MHTELRRVARHLEALEAHLPSTIKREEAQAGHEQTAREDRA